MTSSGRRSSLAAGCVPDGGVASGSHLDAARTARAGGRAARPGACSVRGGYRSAGGRCDRIRIWHICAVRRNAEMRQDLRDHSASPEREAGCIVAATVETICRSLCGSRPAELDEGPAFRQSRRRRTGKFLGSCHPGAQPSTTSPMRSAYRSAPFPGASTRIPRSTSARRPGRRCCARSPSSDILPIRMRAA